MKEIIVLKLFWYINIYKSGFLNYFMKINLINLEGIFGSGITTIANLDSVTKSILPQVSYCPDIADVPYSCREDFPRKDFCGLSPNQRISSTNYGERSGKNSSGHYKGNEIKGTTRVSRIQRNSRFEKVLAKNKRGHRGLQRMFQ